MKRPHLHIHSDCPFFSGSENMLVNFFASPALRESFRLSFTFRATEAYERGFRERVKDPVPFRALPLLDIHDFATARFGILGQRLCTLIRTLLLFKVWIHCWNTFVLFRAFGRDPIDLLHVNNGGFPGSYSCHDAVFAAWLRGVRRIVMVVNNFAVPYTGIQRWIDYPFDRLLVLAGVQFVTGSQAAGHLLREVLSLGAKNHCCIHNGIRPRVLTESPAEVAERLDFPRGRCTLGIIALLEPRKGHRFLLEAMRLVKDALPAGQWPLLLIEGDGSEREALHRQVQDLDIAPLVRFIGREPRVFDLVRALDVMVFSSVSHEDFPNVILEAMMLGKPVVASRMAGVPEQVLDGETGLLVEPARPDLMAAALLTLIRDPARRQGMGRAAEHRFREQFSWETAVGKYGTLFTTLMQGARP